jgi:hypothetical protein
VAGFVGCSGAIVAGSYGVACLFNDPRAILLNLQMLGAFPWGSGLATDSAGRLLALVRELRGIFREAGLVVLAIAILLRPVVRVFARRELPVGPAPAMAGFFLWLALTMLVPAAAGKCKIGGDVNSWALFTLPLTLSAVFALSHFSQRGVIWAAHPYLLVLSLPGILWGSSVSNPWQAAELVRQSDQTILVESHRLARMYKDRIYLPFDPLAHLLAGDPFRPNFDAVFSYSLGGHPVEREAFIAALPVALDRIYFPKYQAFWGLSELGRLLPAFVPNPGSRLPGSFIVLTRSGNPVPTAP